MSAIQATSFTRPQLSNNWRIHSAAHTSAANTPAAQASDTQAQLNSADSFVLSAAKPQIRSLNTQNLPTSRAGFLELYSPGISQIDLSKHSLFQNLGQALDSFSAGHLSQHARQFENLAEQVSCRHGLRSQQPPTAQQAEAVSDDVQTTEHKRPHKLSQHPRLQALRQKVADRLAQAKLQLEQGLNQQPSPRLLQLLKLVSEGLAELENAIISAEPVPQEAQRKGLFALVMSQAMAHLARGNEQEQSTRLQQWALMMDEENQDGSLTPQMMLQTAQKLNSESDDLLAQTAESLELLGPDAAALMQQKIPEAEAQAFQLMQDMTPKELNLWANANKGFVQALRSSVLPAWQTLQSQSKALAQELELLSPEVQALVKQADELALRSLSPAPEAPKGFENGVLSLLREFIKIIQTLDHEQLALQAQQTALILQQRKLDQSFLSNLLEDHQYHQQTQRQRSELQAHIQERYEYLEKRFQQGIAQSLQPNTLA